ETVFHVTVPSAMTLKGMDILGDAVLNPLIDPQELEKEKQVVIEEILEGDERPERKASKLLFQTSYARNPYRFPVIGYKENVERFSREDILTFRKKWYVPENMFLLIVGDVNMNELTPQIEKLFGGLDAKGFFRPPRPLEPTQDQIRTGLTVDDNARETRLLLAFHITSMKGLSVSGLDLAGDILGTRETSRLVRVLKKEKQLVNSISAFSLTPKEPGIFAVSANLDAANLEAATKAIMEEISKLAKDPPSVEELERAKTHIESQHLYARETVDGLARALGSFEADVGDAAYEAKYLQLNSAVTPDEVSRVVERYLMPPNVSIVVLLPKAHEAGFKMDKLTEIVASYTPKEAVAAEAATAKEVVTSTLANGMRVVLVNDDSNPLVSFRVACLGGKRFETKETEGIMNFISQMLTKGTGTKDEVQIANAFEDMGGRVRAFSGYDSFGISVSLFSRHLEAGLALLAELYTDPSFPQDRLDRERNLIMNAIKTEPDRPVPFAVKNLSRVLFPKHPYGFDNNGTLDSVVGFARTDLADTYKRYAVPSNTVIAGVGAFDPAKTLAVIEKLFGAVPATPMVAPNVPKEVPLTARKDHTVTIPRAKTHLTVGFRATTLDNDDRYPLEVLSNILAGQGGRLFLQLRDKESLAYIVTSFFRPGLDPGIFALYMACDPTKTDQALDGLMRELRLVRDQPVRQDELERSVTHLIGTHQIALQSSWARAENTALNALYGLGYDFDAEYVKRISAVTVNDVVRVAQKYLDPERSVVVKIMPE
ncbi:MAG: pitrilysin family protein, partial [Pseudomonadota bacterium]